MKLKFTCLVLLFVKNVISQNAGITTSGTSTVATVITIPSGTSVINPGQIKIIGNLDYISNNGTCYIAGNVINGGNSFDDITATGTEIFNGNTTMSGNISIFNNFTILPSATVNLSSSINIYNNWTNNGLFNHGNKTVTFKGTTNQTITGNTKFFDLTENQGSGANLIYAATQTAIDRNLTVSAGTMTPNNNTLIEFTGAGNLAGGLKKTFYDLQIDNTSAMTITSGGVDINHNFVNNGTYTYSGVPPKLTTFSGSGIMQSFSGLSSSTTTFETVVVGDNHPLSNAITLNCSVNYTVQGGSLSLSHSSTLNNTNNTATFSNTTPSSITGSGIANFNNLTTNVQLNLNTGTTTNVSNYLLINPGSSITTNSPTYGSTATLIYNTINAALPTGLEWNAPGTTPGLGIPKNVTIQNTNNVILAGDRGVGGNLSILSGDVLSFNDHNFTLNGAFAGAGKFTGSSASGLIIGGNAGSFAFTPNIYPSALTNNYLKTFSLSSSLSNATLTDSLNIAAGTYISPGTVTLTGGTLNAGNKLILKSSSQGDARVANSAGTINDSVIVERFIPAHRAWRFLTVPVKSNQTINKTWQEGSVTNPDIFTRYNPHPGFGTEITYDNLITDGYDVNTTYNPSIKYWDSAGSVWTPPSSTYTSINDHSAFCLFVRGSRAVDLSLAVSAPADSTVLRAKGILNEQNGSPVNQNYTTAAGTYLFIGNPYASTIDILNALAHSSGVSQTKFWAWDPEAAGSYGVGGYVTYSSGLSVPSGSTYAGGTRAQSGQAFFVQATSSGMVSTSFQQSDKYSGTESSINRIISIPPSVYTNLMVLSGDSLVLIDGVGAGFDKKFSANVDYDDAEKQWNFKENIALIRGNEGLAIELRPVPVLTDTLFYKLYLYKNQPYALKVFTKNIPSDFPQAWLVDKYLNTKTTLNFNDTTLYNFTPNTDTNSYRNRFMIVFKRTHEATPVATTMSSGGAEAVTLEGTVKVYPNPVVTSRALLKFNNMKAGKYEVTLNSLEGKNLSRKVIQHKGGNDNYSIPLSARWAAGDYLVKISDEKGYSITTKLVIAK